MRLASVLASAAAGGMLLLSPGPSWALSGQCFWARLEQPTRDALLQGYQRLGPEVLDRVPISDRELADIDAACGPGPEDLKERLLTATVLEHGAAAFLKGWMRWDDGAIQVAWGRIDPEQAELLRRQAETIVSGGAPTDESLRRAVGEFLGQDPDRQDPGVVDQARGYLTSRAMREAIERGR